MGAEEEIERMAEIKKKKRGGMSKDPAKRAKQIAALKPQKAGEPSPNDQTRRENKQMNELRKLSRLQVIQVGTLLLQGNIDDLQECVRDKSTTVLQAMIASVAAKAIRKGDHNALDMILDRIVGKVPAAIELSGGDPDTTSPITVMAAGNPHVKKMLASPKAILALEAINKELEENESAEGKQSE